MVSEAFEGFRLSPQQERIWTLQADQTPSPYVVQCQIEIDGPISTESIVTALKTAAIENSILRTTFRAISGMTAPLQQAARGDHAECGWIDCSLLDGEHLKAEVARISLDQRTQMFDFRNGPLLRLYQIVASLSKVHVIVTLPALCSDARGLTNLISEIMRGCRGHSPEPDSNGLQKTGYAHVAQILNELIESDETESGREYWRKRQVSGPPSPKLPFEKQVATQRGLTVGRVAEADITEAIAVAEPVCLNGLGGVHSFLLACWSVVLSRLTACQHITVGAEFDGRTYEGLEEAFGLFARYLPVHVDLGVTSFRRLVVRLEQDITELAEWQDYFSWEPSTSDTSAPASPAFLHYLFSFEQHPATYSFGELSFSVVDRLAIIDRFKMMMSCVRREDGRTVAELSYDSNIFEEQDAQRIAGWFGVLAKSASRHIDSAISQLEMLTAAEKRQLLFAFNSARADYENDKPIECLIELQVRLRPESTAVVFEDQHLTYGALDGRAEGIANRLRIAGAGPESVVAVCIERSLEMMAGLAGVLKSGAAYVPLDPDYPRERLAFMLDDSSAAVLLAQRRLFDLLPASNAQWISIDEAGRGTASPAIAKSERSDLIERLAYVIYTSGSTGRPKGVSISHRAICNRLLWMQKAFPLAADDRVLQKTPVSFDASVWELFLPLIAGAQVILCRQDGHRDTGYMTSLIAEARVTVLQVVPSLLQALLAEPKLAECVSLRRVFSGGEALSAAATRRFLEVGSWKLTNLYGPTETSIDATFFECERGGDRVTIPIGRPLDDVRVHILGAGGELAPPGVPGEIHIGGAGLARGYLKRPDLSAERFVPDEFGDRPGERLYKSGDVGRYLDDGLIEHLGRADDQIKLRGLRIELGEIEFAISGHPDVARSIVMVSGDEAGDRKLVGYYVSKGAQLSARDMRAYLAGRLPQYMIPSRLVPLKTMPLAPNGKVDRPALANFRDVYADGQDQTALLGFTPTEQILAGSWRSILGVERVGVDDSFFALGGHSLLATQAVSRIRDAFSVEIPLRVLFEHPTVNDLAKYIEAAQRAGRGLQIPRIERYVRREFFPLSYEQQRLWFMEQMEPGSAAYNIGVVVRVSGRLDVESLRKSVNEVIRRHETLRTRFATIEGQGMQVVGEAWEIEMEEEAIEGRESEREDAARKRAIEEWGKGFDIEEGPLLRMRLMRIGEEERIVVMVMHHIISDGWSSKILVEEIGRLYEGYRRGEGAELEELRIQYGDYAVWQREWLKGEVLEKEIAYWKRQLEGASEVLELSKDRERPESLSHRGGTEAFSVEEEVYVGLKELSQRAGVTLFITLLTAFVTLLHLHTGDEDISVGTDVANRTRGETEGLIGFFVNQLVIRADLSGDPAFLAMLKRMREVILEAYNYQDVPFDVVVEAINPIRSPKHAPLFQVKILLQDALEMGVELEDVTITPVDIGRSTAQLDLIVNLINTSEYLIGQADYSLDVFKHQDVVRLMANFKALLRSIVADPQRQLSQLSRLSENETGGYEPGDFVDAGLTQSEFDNLIMELGAEPVAGT